ncbi:MAG TPA: pyrimidine 5'-nucleotidase [Candidatus Cybelea sp.]|nr:pyrimidine 5'-nucleotidase [Candidatus Cybelea sp.]
MAAKSEPQSRRKARAKADRVSGAEAWIFDLDNTLYPARCNLFAEIDRRMGEYIAKLLNLDYDSAKRVQKQFFREHGTTMRGLMREHGIDPRGFLEYVHDIDLSPVAPDAGLDAALARLKGRKLVFTNGSVPHAERVLARLGVAQHFEAIYDIVAADFVPKPEPGPYRRFCERYALDPAACVMVEDIARNLKPAYDLGMTTVWVPGVAEWSLGESDLAHVHHVAEDLSAWLGRIAGA